MGGTSYPVEKDCGGPCYSLGNGGSLVTRRIGWHLFGPEVSPEEEVRRPKMLAEVIAKSIRRLKHDPPESYIDRIKERRANVTGASGATFALS